MGFLIVLSLQVEGVVLVIKAAVLEAEELYTRNGKISYNMRLGEEETRFSLVCFLIMMQQNPQKAKKHYQLQP